MSLPPAIDRALAAVRDPRIVLQVLYAKVGPMVHERAGRDSSARTPRQQKALEREPRQPRAHKRWASEPCWVCLISAPTSMAARRHDSRRPQGCSSG